MAVAAISSEEAEHRFFEELDLQAEHVTACLTLMELLLMDLTDGVLPQIALHCYSY